MRWRAVYKSIALMLHSQNTTISDWPRHSSFYHSIKCSTIPLPKIYESEPVWIFFGWNRFSFSQKKKTIATIHACRILGKPYADTVSSLQNHYVYWLKTVENFEIHCNFTRLIFICFIFTQSTPFIKQQQKKINHAFYRSVYQQ